MSDHAWELTKALFYLPLSLMLLALAITETDSTLWRVFGFMAGFCLGGAVTHLRWYVKLRPRRW